jgi:hypothetical protein
MPLCRQHPILHAALIALLLIIVFAPYEGLAATVRGGRQRRLDEWIQDEDTSASWNGTYWEEEDESEFGYDAGTMAASAAAAAATSSLQPRVTVVEGLRSRNGIASISNPGTARRVGSGRVELGTHEAEERAGEQKPPAARRYDLIRSHATRCT